MVVTQDEIYGKLQQVLVEALVVEPEEVTPDARLTEDLGAESIDYLDIAHRTEKAFGIQFKPEDLFLGTFLSEPLVEEGKLTDLGMAELRRRMPYANLDALDQSRDVRDLRGVITVQALVEFVKARLAERG